MRPLQHLFIDGAFSAATADKVMDVVNPSTGLMFAQVSDAQRSDAERALNAAVRAFERWKALSPKERSIQLRRVYDVLTKRVSALAETVTEENGKPFPEAQREVAFGLEYFSWFAEEARRVTGDMVSAPSGDKRYWVMKQPVGVVAAITPWNFPVTMVTRKICPALAAGCTVVLKPAPETPLCALEIARAFQEADVMPGIFNVLPSSNAQEIGEAMLDHPAVRKLAFTGSSAVGKTLMRRASERVLSVSLELGGNAPFIVFDDANLEQAVSDAVAIKYLRVGGQSCICANRIFVQSGIYGAFMRAFLERVQKLKMGDGFENGVGLGPMISEKAVSKLEGLIEGSVREGAKLLVGGQREKGRAGFFFPPTVLDNVDERMTIASQEIFGPVAALYEFKSEEEVVGRANNCEQGLAAYAYTQDMSRIFRLAVSLQCGLLGLNDASGYTHEVPFGGVKESGLGREGGQSGLDAYLQEKTVVLAA